MIVKLRALGWKVDENSRKYYDKQFSIIRAAKDQAKSPPSPPSSPPQTQSPLTPHSPVSLPEGPHSPPASLQEDTVIKEHLNIGNCKLVLKCSDRQVLQLSKQQLCSFFKSRNQVNINQNQEGPKVKINYLAAKPPPPPTFKYSREEILMISENPQSKVTDTFKV